MCPIARSDDAASGVAPRLLSIATAVPPNVLEQDDAAAFAARTFGGRMDGYAALSRVFASTGIARRYLAQPFAWYAEPRGFAERSEAYIDTACELFAAAARQALSAAGLAPADVDAVLFVSSTGIATPSIEARVLPALGFRDDVARLPIFGLGCAGGVTGLAAAATFARGRPGSVVLLVTLELCSLAFRPDRPTKKDLVSTALFGDGAAAAVLSCREIAGAPVLGASTEHLWPETLDIMGWSTDDVGLGVILSRSLPAFIAKNYRHEFDRAAERMGTARADVDRVICHPGATKVLEAIESSMSLPAGSLAVERGVMRDYGNMSSPTVLFVLERSIAEGFHGTAVLTALGPGFTASFLRVDVA